MTPEQLEALRQLLNAATTGMDMVDGLPEITEEIPEFLDPSTTPIDLLNLPQGTEGAYDFIETLPTHLKESYRAELLKCFSASNPSECAAQLMEKYTKMISESEPLNHTDLHVLYCTLIQCFVYSLQKFAIHAKWPNVALKYDTQGRGTYIFLPTVIPTLGEVPLAASANKVPKSGGRLQKDEPKPAEDHVDSCLSEKA